MKKVLVFVFLFSGLIYGQRPSGFNPVGGKQWFQNDVQFDANVRVPNIPNYYEGVQLLYIDSIGLLRKDTANRCSNPCFWNTLGNVNTDTSNFLGTTDSKDLVFKTKGVEAMRVDTNGNVGIGTVAPSAKLEVWGNGMIRNANGNALSNINTDEGFTEFQMNTFSVIDTLLARTGLSIVFSTNTTVIALDDSMNVGIGTDTPTSKLHVVGETYIEGELKLKYAGHDTLTAGIDTVFSSIITDTSLIFLTPQHQNGTTGVGDLTVVQISAGNYFVVHSLKSNATTETNDVRHYNWAIIKRE